MIIHLLNYLIPIFLIAYALLVWFTLKAWFTTEQAQIPKRGTKAWLIYMHGQIWFHILWITVAIGFGSIVARWIKEQLGGV